VKEARGKLEELQNNSKKMSLLMVGKSMTVATIKAKVANKKRLHSESVYISA
jgi:hypothetical protein